MTARALRFRLGLFVIITVGLLAMLILMFGSGSLAGWFRRTNNFTITLSEAPGVTPGTPVRRSGVRIGEATSVKLDDETGKVIVGIGIDKQFTIRKNEQPTLTASVLGGDTAIDFVPQKPEPGQPPLDTSAVPPGTTIAGVTGATVGTLLSRAVEVVPSTQEMINDIRKSLQRLEKMSPLAEETLREYRDLARDTRATIPDLRKTNTEAESFIRSLREIVPDFRETNREALKFVRSLNEAFPEVRKTNSDLQELIKQANSLAPDVRTAVRDIGAAAQQYNKLGEDLDKLIRDNQQKIVRIIENTNATLERAMDLLSNENRRNVTDTIRNLRNASDRLPEMTKNLDETLTETRLAAKRLRASMDKADEALTNVRDLTKPLAQRGPDISRNLDESLDKFNRILTDVRELVRAVGESDGTLNRLLKDPSVYNHIDETICGIGKMVPRLDRVLKDIETFADKLARHPESIGIGGVVRPGSGVKDPPAPYPGYVVPPGH